MEKYFNPDNLSYPDISGAVWKIKTTPTKQDTRDNYYVTLTVGDDCWEVSTKELTTENIQLCIDDCERFYNTENMKSFLGDGDEIVLFSQD